MSIVELWPMGFAIAVLLIALGDGYWGWLVRPRELVGAALELVGLGVVVLVLMAIV